MTEPVVHSNSFGSSIGLPSSPSRDLCAEIKKVATICLAILFVAAIAAGASYAIAAYVVCAPFEVCVISSIITGALAALIAIACLNCDKSRFRGNSGGSDFSYQMNSQVPYEPDTPDGLNIDPEQDETQTSIETPNNPDTPNSNSVHTQVADNPEEEEIKESHSAPLILDKEGFRTPPDPTDHTKLLAVNTKESYENNSQDVVLGSPKEDLIEPFHGRGRGASLDRFRMRRIKQTTYRTMSADQIPELLKDSDEEDQPDSAPLQSSSAKDKSFWVGPSIINTHTRFDELQHT